MGLSATPFSSVSLTCVISSGLPWLRPTFLLLTFHKFLTRLLPMCTTPFREIVEIAAKIPRVALVQLCLFFPRFEFVGATSEQNLGFHLRVVVLMALWKATRAGYWVRGRRCDIRGNSLLPWTPRKYVHDVTSVGQRSSPWTCNSVEVETKFHLECKLHFPSAQLMLRQMHLTKVFESVEAKYWASWLSFDV